MIFRLLKLAFLLRLTLGDVINLSEEDFSKFVDGSTNALVEFYAPWCGHCKNLAPEWKIAGETFQSSDDIIIAAVDATVSQSLASKYGVKGYPTIKFFPKGSTSAEDYNGGRTADSIVSWVNDKIGTSRKVKVAPSAVTALTTENFDTQVLGSKAALVEFYAPWCGHCKSLAPVYEQLAKVFEGEKDVIIAKVDATEEKDLSSRYGITGFPTLKFFPHDSSEPMDYNSGRDLESFVSFLNDNAGTHRDADGGLLETAGRIPEFDLFLAESLIDHELAEKLEKKLDALTLKAHDYGKMYLNYVKKVIHKGEEFIDNEMKRLENMVRSTNVSPESRTLFQLKQNILRAFKKEPVADAEGTMKGEL